MYINKLNRSTNTFQDKFNIMHFILEDTNNNPYTIQMPIDIVGLPEYYDNYTYLGWWLGNEPQKEAKDYYIIYERKTNIPKLTTNESRYDFPHHVVVKGSATN